MMQERLTNKNYNGGAYVYENELEESPFTHENKGVYYGNAIDRLAAYEDTGLTPGDVKDLQALCEENGLAKYVDLIVQAKRQMGKDNERSIEQDERIEQLEAELVEYEHLQKEVTQLARESVEREKTLARLEAEVAELAKAKADGRLVELPCKVGDEICFILPEINGEMVVSDPHKVTEAGTRGFWNSSFPRDDPDGMHDFTAWGEVGVSAFLTRAEAEAALKGVE